MALISTKLRGSARGQRCTIGVPGVCNHNPETTVLAHAPSEFKGMGLKGPDYWAAFACSACHEHLDHNRLMKSDAALYWLSGIHRTQEAWRGMGLLVFPMNVPRKKTSSKILPRRMTNG